MIKKRSTYQKRRHEEKQREKKLSIKKHSTPHFFGLGGLSHKEEKNYQKGEICRQILKDRIYGIDTSIVLSLYPTIFGYSHRGYSHRERCRAPDRRESIERSRAEADK
jgi:hypothetical protein